MSLITKTSIILLLASALFAQAPKAALTDAQRIELLQANLLAERARARAAETFTALVQQMLTNPQLTRANADRDAAVAAAQAKLKELSKICGTDKLDETGHCVPAK